jgi:hypothetical protein
MTNCSAVWQYGKVYEYDAPVKLLDKHLHAMGQSTFEELVVVSQVLVTKHFIYNFSAGYLILLWRLCCIGCLLKLLMIFQVLVADILVTKSLSIFW